MARATLSAAGRRHRFAFCQVIASLSLIKAVPKESAARLRRRWQDPAGSAELLAPVEQFVRDGRLDRTLDLRGAEIGMQAPLGDFQLFGKHYSNLDLSVGRGALGIYHCTVTNLIARRFQFDRASHFVKARVERSFFSGFKGRFEARDAAFLECDFSESAFRGGFNEYGFTRCVFDRCSFVSARWVNTYFKACSFKHCQLEGALFDKCYVAGVRLDGGVAWADLFRDCDIRSLYLDGVQVTAGATAG